MGSLAKQLSGQGQQKVFAKGGAVHSDEAQDKKLIKRELAKAMSKTPKKLKKGGKC